MYAIIDDGNAQYMVEPGKILDVQLRDLPEGEQTVTFDKVLLVRDGEDVKIGRPYLSAARVIGTLQAELRGPKITIIKHRRRKDSHLKKGHRQNYLRVTIDRIEV